MPRAKAKAKSPKVLGVPTNDKERAQLAYAVLDQIDAHPETWEQRSYRCGTGMCFAGWTTQLAGLPWRSDDLAAFQNHWLDTVTLDDSVLIDGQHLPAHDAARDVLGLSYDNADTLFASYNDMDDLRELVVLYFGSRP